MINFGKGRYATYIIDAKNMQEYNNQFYNFIHYIGKKYWGTVGSISDREALTLFKEKFKPKDGVAFGSIHGINDEYERKWFIVFNDVKDCVKFEEKYFRKPIERNFETQIISANYNTLKEDNARLCKFIGGEKIPKIKWVQGGVATYIEKWFKEKFNPKGDIEVKTWWERCGYSYIAYFSNEEDCVKFKLMYD